MLTSTSTSSLSMMLLHTFTIHVCSNPRKPAERQILALALCSSLMYGDQVEEQTGLFNLWLSESQSDFSPPLSPAEFGTKKALISQDGRQMGLSLCWPPSLALRPPNYISITITSAHNPLLSDLHSFLSFAPFVRPTVSSPAPRPLFSTSPAVVSVLDCVSLPFFCFIPHILPIAWLRSAGSSISYLDCFGLQFETVERVDGLVCIVGIHVVYKAVAQTLTWNRKIHLMRFCFDANVC